MRLFPARLTMAGVFFATGLCAEICRRMPPRVDAEEALLARQVEGLRVLTAEAARGQLVDSTHVLVVVDEHLVQDLLRAATPFEETVGDRLKVRVESAVVSFSDGFALVRLDGRASLVGR